MAGAKQSMPVKRMKSSATSRDWVSLCLVAADAVLDPPDGLDLALHGRTQGVCLGHDLGTRGPVLRDAHARAIEQHRLPALGETGA